MSDEKTKWTPGPWVVHCPETLSCGLVKKGYGEAPIADVFRVKADKDNAEFGANLRLVAAAPELADALRVALFWAINPDEGQLARFERVADAFYAATGIMRPGKSDPLETHSYDEREKAFTAWVNDEARKSVAAMRAALQKAGVLP